MKNSRLLAVALAGAIATTVWARCEGDPTPATAQTLAAERATEAHNTIAEGPVLPEHQRVAPPTDLLADEPLDPIGLANGTGTLELQAFHERDNQPAAGMNLRLLRSGEQEAVQRARTEECGKATFLATPAGTYVLRNDRGDRDREVTIRAGATTRIPYPVSAGICAQGVVTDETGTAIAGARIEVTEKDGGDTYWVASSDAAGQFTVLDVSVDFRLSASIADRTSATTSLRSSPKALHLVLRPDGCCVAGFVILPNGAPIREALVTVDALTSARTDQFGRFVRIGLSAGSHNYTVQAPGRETARGTVEISPTQPGELRIVMQEQASVEPKDSQGNALVNPAFGRRSRNW